MRFPLFLATAAMVLSSVAFADDALQLEVASKAFQPQKIAVLNAINSDEQYAEISKSDRATVVKALDNISVLMPEQTTFDLLDANNRKTVLAQQELINVSLKDAMRDSKMICRKEAVLGSNMPKRICMTYAEHKRQAEATQDALMSQGKANSASAGSQ